jgi:branched-chain amino acid transport system ATP-binding protein
MTLRADDVTVQFGGILAISKVTLALEAGEILGLIGPNGAGKTTMVNVLTGFQRPHRGAVRIAEQRCDALTPDDFARRGVVRTFQAVRLFGKLTVSENVEVALGSLGLGRSAGRRRALEVLAALRLADKAHLPANALSYGDERRVGIARALAMEPKFLLLDEPAAGLNFAEAEELCAFIAEIRTDYGCGILVIEHNMKLAMSICERIHVLATGQTLAEGTPAEILADPAVRSAYLGSEAA